MFVDEPGGVEHAPGLLQILVDALVLLPGKIAGDGAGDDATRETLALLLQLCDALLGHDQFGLRAGVLLVELDLESDADGLGELGRYAHGGVVPLNGRFHGLDREVLLGADGASLVAAQTVEVGVLAFGESEAQAGAAAAAEDAALEVVVMHASLLSGDVMGFEHGLDGVEQGLRDEGLVMALVLDALEGHVAEVVAVTQQVMDVGGLHGADRTLAMRQGGQATSHQLVGQGADGVATGGVGLVGPLDELGSVGVDNHNADLAALDAPPGVEIPDGRSSRRSASLGLLGHALDGLGGQVARVELGDASHDRVEELPGRGLVDVLLHRDELGPIALQLEQGVGVVATVAGEAVDLVEDDVVDVEVGADAGEHLLELGAVSGLGRFAAVEVLPHDLCAKVAGLAAAGFTLGG